MSFAEKWLHFSATNDGQTLALGTQEEGQVDPRRIKKLDLRLNQRMGASVGCIPALGRVTHG
jgi:hypothetical protein